MRRVRACAQPPGRGAASLAAPLLPARVACAQVGRKAVALGTKYCQGFRLRASVLPLDHTCSAASDLYEGCVHVCLCVVVVVVLPRLLCAVPASHAHHHHHACAVLVVHGNLECGKGLSVPAASGPAVVDAVIRRALGLWEGLFCTNRVRRQTSLGCTLSLPVFTGRDGSLSLCGGLLLQLCLWLCTRLVCAPLHLGLGGLAAVALLHDGCCWH